MTTAQSLVKWGSPTIYYYALKECVRSYKTFYRNIFTEEFIFIDGSRLVVRVYNAQEVIWRVL